MIEVLRAVGIVPVVKINRAAPAAGLACALCEGGLPAVEITFRTPAAADAIREACAAAPEAFVCAGTVLTAQQAEQAVAAGAKAIVSPGTNMEVVDWCLAQGVPVIPGCATPSEIEVCMRKGLRLVKLFPAEVLGGVRMLKALAGPYAGVSFMATGGISPANVGDYLLRRQLDRAGSGAGRRRLRRHPPPGRRGAGHRGQHIRRQQRGGSMVPRRVLYIKKGAKGQQRGCKTLRFAPFFYGLT